MLKKIIAGISLVGLLSIPAFAKYECERTGMIVGTKRGEIQGTRRLHIDLDGKRDSKGNLNADVIRLFVFHRDCFRKLREYKPGTESKYETYLKDYQSVKDYIRSLEETK